ncbi:winged helix DNA-binding domain-containing protein [bacterium]|nr:winged helix DNA-binding domain-containing protein [bacterium]
MASHYKLSPSDARRLVISRHGLRKANAFGKGKKALLDCIERLGYIQIDTISVINRAHCHTFWTRVPTFLPNQLDELQKDRKVFEYWSHAAALLPMQDFRFCLPYMNAIASGQKHWRTPNKKTMKQVLGRIRSDGPLSAKHFEDSTSKTAGQWGGFKPAKIALEQLFIEGKLIISHRDGFQKVYDLPERVLPRGLDLQEPTQEEFCRYLIDRTIRSQGVATQSEIGYLRKGYKAKIGKQLQQMLTDNEIVQVSVQGNPEAYYSRQEIVEKSYSTRVTPKIHLLSPFDNLVIQRKRAVSLFDFDYKIECYLPEIKREYGYFCLPILFGDEFVGRLDPKADRKSRTLLVRNLVIEKKVPQLELFTKILAKKLMEFARFNDCERYKIERCNNKKIWSSLSRKSD